MPRESMAQRKTTGRVMHEFAHGELKSGRAGKGGTNARTTTRRRRATP